MSNMTPFEIRLELLKMAKDMLEQDYFARREELSAEWRNKCEAAKLHGQPAPDHPTSPPYPSETEIIRKASELNSFVSHLNPTQEKSKKST